MMPRQNWNYLPSKARRSKWQPQSKSSKARRPVKAEKALQGILTERSAKSVLLQKQCFELARQLQSKEEENTRLSSNHKLQIGMMNVIEKEVDSMKKMLDKNEQRQSKTTSMLDEYEAWVQGIILQSKDCIAQMEEKQRSLETSSRVLHEKETALREAEQHSDELKVLTEQSERARKLSLTEIDLLKRQVKTFEDGKLWLINQLQLRDKALQASQDFSTQQQIVIAKMQERIAILTSSNGKNLHSPTEVITEAAHVENIAEKVKDARSPEIQHPQTQKPELGQKSLKAKCLINSEIANVTNSNDFNQNKEESWAIVPHDPEFAHKRILEQQEKEISERGELALTPDLEFYDEEVTIETNSRSGSRYNISGSGEDSKRRRLLQRDDLVCKFPDFLSRLKDMNRHESKSPVINPESTSFQYTIP